MLAPTLLKTVSAEAPTAPIVTRGLLCKIALVQLCHHDDNHWSKSLTLYPPRGGVITPPLRKSCFSSADLEEFLEIFSREEAISEYSQTSAIY